MDAIKTIKEYIENVLYPPKSTWSNYDFRKRSLERSAAFYILNEMENDPDADPKEIIKSFISKMDSMSETFVKPDMFIIAREQGKEIYYLFC